MARCDVEVDCYPPWNFSWVVENELAVMGWPQTTANVKFIVKEGIRHLVTLSPEKLPALSAFPDLHWTQIPIVEFEAPKIKQIIKFIEACQKCHVKKQVGTFSVIPEI